VSGWLVVILLSVVIATHHHHYNHIRLLSFVRMQNTIMTDIKTIQINTCLYKALSMNLQDAQ